MTADLRDRVSRLEAAVERLERELAASAPAAAGTADRERAPWPAPVPRTPAAWPQPEPVAERRPPLPDTETILKWAGVGLVVLAVGFAVSTAISRGWIGPELQLAGAVALSLALIGTGLRLRSSRPGWTHALCSGGVLALSTTFASTLFRDQVSDDVALAATATVGVLGAVLASRIASEWVATAALLGSVAGWLVVAEGATPFTASLVWFAGAVVASVWLGARHGWAALHLVAHVAGMVLGVVLAADADEGWRSVAAIVVATALFASLAWRPGRHPAASGGWTTAWRQIEIQLVTLAAPWLLLVAGVGFELDGKRPWGIAAIVVAAVTVAVATGVRTHVEIAAAVSLLVGASVDLTIGLALLLTATVAYAAIAVHAAGLVVVARRLHDDVKVFVVAALNGLAAATFVVTATIRAWTEDAPVGDDVIHLVIIAALGGGAWQVGVRSARVLAALGSLALLLIWLGSVLVHLPQGQAAVSISWAVVGVAVFVLGAVRKLPEAGAAGLAVIALTVAKLLTIDLQEVDTLWRAGLFLVIGLGIMRLGFLLPRLTRESHDDGDPAREAERR